MKKFYAIVTAALMSVSLFATAPTQSDIAGFAQPGHYVACFGTPEGATCNEIVWVGEYNSWNLQDEDILKCEELTGFPGWYYVVVPVVEGKSNDGKPVQLNECGKRNWDWQCGTVELVAGTVNVVPNGAECDLKGWSESDPGIVNVTAWKNNVNPCEATCATFALTLRVYPPYCEYNDELAPTVKGSWDWDAAPIALEFQGSYFECTIPDVQANVQFKFNNDPAGSWTNEFMYYDGENDTWKGFGNISLDPEDAMSKFYTRTGNTLTFDFSDETKFKYASCEEADPEDEEEHKVFVQLWAPEGTPAAGPEIIGEFNNWLNEPAGPQVILTLVDGLLGPEYDGVITVAKGKHEFKIREANNWDNQIKMIDSNDELQDFQPKFKDAWLDAEGLVEGAAAGDKVVLLDLSSGFAWSAPQGIENVVLTEKAQKVMVDGVLYIIRDNKMFNVQGAQVR